MKKTFALKEAKITINGKYLNLNLTKSPGNLIADNDLAQCKSLVDRIDHLCTTLEKEFHISLTRRGKPKRKFKELLEQLSGHRESADASATANTILSTLSIIVDSLRVVNANNHDAFVSIKRNLNKESSGNAFWGFVFELLIAAAFSMKGIKYIISSRQNGGADFILETEDGNAHVECHALFPTAEYLSHGEMMRKIHGGILSKEKKSYANNNCALFIDTSNLVRYQTPGINYDMGEFIPETSKFGNITLVTSFMTRNEGSISYSLGWNRHDYELCSPQLKQPLNQVLPSEEDSVTHFIDGTLSF